MTLRPKSVRPHVFKVLESEYDSSESPPPHRKSPFELPLPPEDHRSQSNPAAPAHPRDFRKKRGAPPLGGGHLQDASEGRHRHRTRHGVSRADAVRAGRPSH